MHLTHVATICSGRGFPSPVMGSLQSATPPTCVAQQATPEDKTLGPAYYAKQAAGRACTRDGGVFYRA